MANIENGMIMETNEPKSKLKVYTFEMSYVESINVDIIASSPEEAEKQLYRRYDEEMDGIVGTRLKEVADNE